MDSLTQMVLGAAVAAAVAPARHRHAALLAGAVLGTLPDLDGLAIALLTDDPVRHMVWHRGASHSLLVLPWVAWLLWAWLRTRGGRVAESPRRWFWAIALALCTHPLLDAFTVYGTQLLWPLPLPPVMWSSLFIIDPLYTAWLLLACVAAFFLRERVAAQRVLVAGLAISSAYLGWSLLAKAQVEREAERALAALGLADAPRFSVPTPFNTLLWRVVAMTPQGYVEGFRSLAADRGPMAFRAHASDGQALAGAGGLDAVRRLSWFNRGFMRARVDGDRLELADLRMGSEPDYVFRFLVAQRGCDGWQAIPPQALDVERELEPLLGEVWRRIWQAPASVAGADAAGAPSSSAAGDAHAASDKGTPAISASK